MYKFLILTIAVVFISCGEKSEPAKQNLSSGEIINPEFSATVKKYDNTVTDSPTDILDKFMYMNGYRMADNMLKDSLNFNLDYMIQGFVDGLKYNSSKIPTDSMDAVFQEFSDYMNVKMEAMMKRKEIEMSVLSVQNLDEAERFWEQNSKEPGVITLPSKLQYKIIQEGSGRIPTSTDHVLVHMTSTFPDGNVFDDTRTGEPRLIPNEKMIPGWLEAITKMPEGSRWVLYLHPSLAFGEFGTEGKVPPNKFTIVDVELIKIMSESEIQEYLRKNPPKPPVPGGPLNEPGRPNR
ncbi:MAG: FKBP-type peptidyl-prolyl cis-trans isomerase N-terminal domain-containing protein [Candidatus Kapaibacterium sp.]|jgi:FKBP-type peptidyl-prolyl cis-trans isomerase|nr:FKBP-type peptidyl-prolyl cis-trans isomerase N-terminal domain-containing protein [Candidatus Kapabacteria bacterium]